jgi:hypothetical protein
VELMRSCKPLLCQWRTNGVYVNLLGAQARAI